MFIFLCASVAGERRPRGVKIIILCKCVSPEGPLLFMARKCKRWQSHAPQQHTLNEKKQENIPKTTPTHSTHGLGTKSGRNFRFHCESAYNPILVNNSGSSFWCCGVFVDLLFSVFCFLQGVACCMQIEGDRVRFSFGLRASASRLLPPRSQRQS